MAIDRNSDGTLLLGDLSVGGRAIDIAPADSASHVASIGWLDEGVGIDLSLEEAVAVRDELDRLIRVATS